ncbi:MAG: hypothetical protein KAR19_03510 [Bacteroidales bacterium]|nr:hypothetical protein [Bacteroidales bacterium]
MQRMFLLVVLAVFIGSCNQTAKKESKETQVTEMEQVISATIEELLAQPADYVGKEVAISGMVTHVCSHGGQKCFVLASDGETQIRIVTGGEIDEFKTSLEGSNVAFKGVFTVLNKLETDEHVEDHDSKEHHSTEMAHTEAEKAEYFIEAVDYREITQ